MWNLIISHRSHFGIRHETKVTNIIIYYCNIIFYCFKTPWKFVRVFWNDDDMHITDGDLLWRLGLP